MLTGSPRSDCSRWLPSCSFNLDIEAAGWQCRRRFEVETTVDFTKKLWEAVQDEGGFAKSDLGFARGSLFDSLRSFRMTPRKLFRRMKRSRDVGEPQVPPLRSDDSLEGAK